MILTCPNCGSRFELAAELLAPKGKKVKCSACGEKWHQLPDPQELRSAVEDEKIDDDFAALLKQAEEGVERKPKAGRPAGDIPASLRPDHRVEDLKIGARVSASAKIAGYVGAALVFVLVFAALLAFQANVTNAWPASVYFYEMIGRETQIPGDGLVFDQLRAEMTEDEQGRPAVKVSGAIVNLKREQRQVPLMEATLRDENAEALEILYIQPPRQIVGAEDTMPFQAVYPYEGTAVRAVNVRFVLK